MNTFGLVGLVALFGIGASAYGQTNPVLAQFEHLMGEPKNIVHALLDFPWKPDLPDELPGLHKAARDRAIRIASVEQPLGSYSRWTHWENEDGTVWVDFVTFAEPGRSAQLLRSARQSHAGYHWDNQLLLFSGTGDLRREAVGAALSRNGELLNIGVKLPMEVHWDRPLPEPDRAAFDAALARFQVTLEDVARKFLDPEYLQLGAKIKPKPEALPILRMAGFARLWSYVKYNFVYIDRRPGLNWDSILEQYLPRIAKAKDDIEYGRILQHAVALLREGHTNVYPSSVEPQDAPLVLLEPIEGKPVVTLVGSLPELKPIERGMELLEIDGTPAKTTIDRDIDPYISSSTIQDRQLRWMHLLLQGPPGSQMRAKWLTLDGGILETLLARNGSQQRSALKIPMHPPFQDKELAGNIAYIGLGSFESPSTASDFERRFEPLRHAKAWIIDLRWNGGGSSSVGYKILSHFIDKTLEGSKSSSRLYNPTVAALGAAQGWHEWPTDQIQPAAGPHYEGPIYVLTSARTCSAAEDFLIPLRIAKRITIVGEPTCGSTGQPLQFSIYGAVARVCTKWDRFPDGTDFVGTGVMPDVKAARTKRDVAIGRDTVFEAALKLARGQ